jgi:uncharacterized membrane protein YdbT with pleckstrin-like domain
VGPTLVTLLLIALVTGALVFAPEDGLLRSLTIWGGIGIALFVFIFYPVRKFIAWVTSYFVVTSDRVIHREGWIAKRSMDIPLEAINDVRFSQNLFERIIGAGDLIISSASEYGRQVFGDIRHPEEVQKTIYHQGELNKERMYRGQAGPPPAAPSTMSELERLGKLRADGVLTEAEFEEQKKKILGGS